MAIVTFQNLFAILADPENQVLPGILAEVFPTSHIQIRPGQWFLVGSGTTQEISTKLKVTPGNEAGAAVILAVSGYYGRASAQVWEWVAAQVGKPTDGQ
jgi:hypothetical protein